MVGDLTDVPGGREEVVSGLRLVHGGLLGGGVLAAVKTIVVFFEWIFGGYRVSISCRRWSMTVFGETSRKKITVR